MVAEYLVMIEHLFVKERYDRLLRHMRDTSQSLGSENIQRPIPNETTLINGTICYDHDLLEELSLPNLPVYHSLVTDCTSFVTTGYMSSKNNTKSKTSMNADSNQSGNNDTLKDSNGASFTPRPHAVDALDVADVSSALVRSIECSNGRAIHSVLMYVATHLPDRLHKFIPEECLVLIKGLVRDFEKHALSKKKSDDTSHNNPESSYGNSTGSNSSQASTGSTELVHEIIELGKRVISKSVHANQ